MPVCGLGASKTYLDQNILAMPFPALVSRYFGIWYGGWGMKNFSQNDRKRIICMGSASWGEGSIRLHSEKVSQDVKRNHLLFLFVLV